MFDDESYLKNRPAHLFVSFLIGIAAGTCSHWSFINWVTKPYSAITCNLNDDKYSDLVVFNANKRPYMFLGTENGLKLVDKTYAPENSHLLKRVKELKLEEAVRE